MNLHDTDYTAGITWGGNGQTADGDLSLSRTRQAQALQRQAPQIDYSGANASLGQVAALQQHDAGTRAQQGRALDALQAQSSGRTASAAGINAGLGTQSAFQAALQGQAAGRTGLANAAMGRQALQAGGMGQLANTQQAALARQQEFGAANQSLGSYAGDVRQGDYAAALSAAKSGAMQGAMATSQGQQNLSQQQLNQQYAENQMQQRYGIGQAQVQGEESALNRYYGDMNQYYQNQLAGQEAMMGLIGAGTQAAGSLGAAAATSFGGSSGGSGASMGGNAATAGASVNNSASSFNQAYAMPTSPSDVRTKEPATDALSVDRGVMADANRRMAGEPYRYKPEFTPPDEVPGQLHHGFMAQNLEQNPVTATAVQKDANGVRVVHGHRMLQAVASGLSDLQRQMDEMRGGAA